MKKYIYTQCEDKYMPFKIMLTCNNKWKFNNKKPTHQKRTPLSLYGIWPTFLRNQGLYTQKWLRS